MGSGLGLGLVRRVRLQLYDEAAVVEVSLAVARVAHETFIVVIAQLELL